MFVFVLYDVITGLQCLYPISQSDSALKLTRILAAIAPKGPASPIMINELTSDKEELEFIRTDHRRLVPTRKTVFLCFVLLCFVLHFSVWCNV